MNAAQMLKEAEVLFLLGADELNMAERTKGFTVYISSLGDVVAHHADVTLTGATYTDNSGIYVNTLGRVQIGVRAAFAPGEAKEDWAILRALSDVLDHTLPFDSLPQLRAALYEAHPYLGSTDEIVPGEAGDIARAAGLDGTPAGAGFESPVKDFYLTNPIARASAVMAECSQLAKGAGKIAAE